MTVSISGTSGIVNDATDLNYTGTLTGGTGVVNLGSGQVYKDASGNVGIGTSSPAAKLHVVNSTGTCAVRIDCASGGASNGEVTFGAAGFSTVAGLKFDDANARVDLYTLGERPLRFLTNNTERARIDSSGNLLVGTTSSIGTTVAKVEILGASGGGRPLNTKVDIATSANQISFNNTNGQVGSISTNGSTTAYNTSSDYRLKEAIAPMTGALARVAALRPCTYKWKADGSDGQGFIAHELAEVEAGCVTGEKDAVDAEGNPQYQGIDTSFLVATLAAAIQEQQALIAAQAISITALNERLTALEAPIV